MGLHHFPASLFRQSRANPQLVLRIPGWAERSRRICLRLQRRWPTWKVNSLLAESHSCFEGKLRLWYWSICVELIWNGLQAGWGSEKKIAPKSERQLHGRSATETGAGGSWLINLRMQLFKQHQVFDRVVLPGASHLLLATAAHLRLNENASALELTDTIFECRGAWWGLGQSMVVWVGLTWSYKNAGTRPGAGPIALTQTYWTRVNGSVCLDQMFENVWVLCARFLVAICRYYPFLYALKLGISQNGWSRLSNADPYQFGWSNPCFPQIQLDSTFVWWYRRAPHRFSVNFTPFPNRFRFNFHYISLQSQLTMHPVFPYHFPHRFQSHFSTHLHHPRLPFVIEAPLKVQCYASAERTEVLSRAVDDDSSATVHARVGGVRPVVPERADEERLQRWRCLEVKALENPIWCGQLRFTHWLGFNKPKLQIDSGDIYQLERASTRIRVIQAYTRKPKEHGDIIN